MEEEFVKPIATADNLTKIARALALMSVKDLNDNKEKALVLMSIGFNAAEISQLLRVSKNYANVATHRERISGKKRKAVA